MEGCAIPPSSDMDELIVNGYISRLLADNTSLLIIFAVMAFILIGILWYFVKQAYTTYKEYKNNIVKSGTTNNDEDEKENEEFDASEIDPTKYQEAGKMQFIKAVDKKYNEYNLEKTAYIKATYGKENDDYIDQRIAYNDHDDYDYNSNKIGT